MHCAVCVTNSNKLNEYLARNRKRGMEIFLFNLTLRTLSSRRRWCEENLSWEKEIFKPCCIVHWVVVVVFSVASQTINFLKQSLLWNRNLLTFEWIIIVHEMMRGLISCRSMVERERLMQLKRSTFVSTPSSYQLSCSNCHKTRR